MAHIENKTRVTRSNLPPGACVWEVEGEREAMIIGESTREVSARGRELVATYETTVIAKPLLDPIVVKNGQGDGGLANSSGTNESDWDKVLGEIDYLLDQFVATKEDPRWRRWRFPGFTRWKYETTDPSVVDVADLL